MLPIEFKGSLNPKTGFLKEWSACVLKNRSRKEAKEVKISLWNFVADEVVATWKY